MKPTLLKILSALAIAAASTTCVLADSPESRIGSTTPDICPEGVPSAVSPNYLTEGPDAPAEPFCLEFEIRSDGPGSSAGYLPATSAPELCGIHTYGRVIRLLKFVSQCGVVLYGMGGWESPGVLMGGPGGIAIKTEVFRLTPTLQSLDPARFKKMRAMTARAEWLLQSGFVGGELPIRTH